MIKVIIFKSLMINLKSISYKKFIILSMFSCSTMSFINYNLLKNIDNVSFFDFIFIIFCGPSINEKKLFICFQWLFMNLIILFLFSDISYTQIFHQGTLIVTRVRSRMILWLSQVVSLILMVILFYIIQFIFVMSLASIIYPLKAKTKFSNVFSILYGIKINISNMQSIILLFSLLIMATSSIIIMQSLFALILKNSVLALVITIIIQSLTIISGNINTCIVRWLPSNQGILLRHDIFSLNKLGFSITWSVIYCSIFILILFLIGLIFINNLDIY